MKDDKIKTPSLYELTDDFKALMDFGYDAETEEAFLDTLDGILGGIQDKADAYCSVLSRFKGNVDMIKAEENRLKARREVIEHNIERMKEALQMALETMEEGGMKPEIKTGLHTIKLAGNGGKQPLKVIEDKVPDSFKKIILETDKEKIRAAIEAGEDVSEFAELLPRGRHVSIR